MELNWTTFSLEIANFLVLVWLLKRLLYKPVQEAMARRREGIEAQLQQARTLEAQAEELRALYEGRLADWERERHTAQALLATEIDRERRRLLAELQQELAAEKKKSEVLAQRQASQERVAAEIRALELATRFAYRLLMEFGSVEMDARLADKLLAEMQGLPAGERMGLFAGSGNGAGTVEVVSAYPLDKGRRHRLRKAFDSLLARPLSYEFLEDRELIAGLRVTVGSWVIQANLQDELYSLAAIAHER